MHAGKSPASPTVRGDNVAKTYPAEHGGGFFMQQRSSQKFNVAHNEPTMAHGRDALGTVIPVELTPARA